MIGEIIKMSNKNEKESIIIDNGFIYSSKKAINLVENGEITIDEYIDITEGLIQTYKNMNDDINKR